MKAPPKSAGAVDDYRLAQPISASWETLCQGWLEDGGRSPDTIRAYRTSHRRLAAWCLKFGTTPLNLSRDDVETFKGAMEVSGRLSAIAIRATCYHLSSLFSWIQRRHPEVENPFRRISAAAPNERRLSPVPTREEVQTLVRTGPREQVQALAAIAYLGLPIPALSRMEIENGSYHTKYKERKIAGVLPKHLEKLLGAPEGTRCRPFARLGNERIARQIQITCRQHFLRGQIKQRYTSRDLIAFFVIEEWRRNPDIEALTHRLGYSNPAVTLRLLKRLGLEE